MGLTVSLLEKKMHLGCDLKDGDVCVVSRGNRQQPSLSQALVEVEPWNLVETPHEERDGSIKFNRRVNVTMVLFTLQIFSTR